MKQSSVNPHTLTVGHYTLRQRKNEQPCAKSAEHSQQGVWVNVPGKESFQILSMLGLG
jgi:hypothetical protein